jgi:DNA-binding transcriptional ArsR family regulator
MVTQANDSAPDVFHAVSDKTRRSILNQLRVKEIAAGEIAMNYMVSRPAVSKHLRILREAGLVSETRFGRERRYRLQPDKLAEIDSWLQAYRRFWEASLVNLKHLVESSIEEEQG